MQSKPFALRPSTRITWRVVLSIAFLAAMVSVASAQGGYSLARHSVQSGVVATGGGFTLIGAAGQADAGLLSGGGFTLQGGFLTGGAPAVVQPPEQRQIFLPGLHR